MITIITASFNSEDTIEDCCVSVRNQIFQDYEHLIIDGGSTDNTLEKIKSLNHKKIRLISEPDRGIFDAFNKGLREANGEIIGFLNSDDYFSNEDVLDLISNEFKLGANVIYGDLRYVSQKNEQILRKWTSQKFSGKLISSGWMPPHPTFYFLKDIHNKEIFFDESLKVASDYKFMLKILSISSYKISYIPSFLVNMRMGGNSNGSIGNIIRKMKEDYLILNEYSNFPLISLAYKNLSKLRQFF